MKFREKFRSKKLVGLFFLVLIVVFFGGIFLNVALAQDTGTGVDLFSGEADAVTEATGLSDAPLGEIIGNIISIVLGLVGIVLVGFIIYAGIIWMTAGGDEEKVTKAKTTLRNSVIGLVIILSSWAIASWVISSLGSAVSDDGSYGGSGGSGGLGGGSGSGGGFGGDYGDEVFQVSSIIPEGEVSIRNLKVKIYFNHSLDLDTVSAENIQILNSDVAVEGELNQVNSRLIEFIPSEYCPEPNDSYHCFAADSDFAVNVSQAVMDSNGENLIEDYSANFRTGSLVDTESPSVSILEPSNYQSVSVEDVVGIQAQYADDSGVAVAEFFADEESFADPILFSPAELSGSVYQLWATTGIDPMATIPLQVRVSDLADNTSTSPTVRVYTRPEHCFNNNMDEAEGELGVDCGGDCGACSGETCSVDSDCYSGLCVSGTCRYPVKITDLSPDAGDSGNYVTIKGINFGAYDAANSQVEFISQLDGQSFVADFACGLENWYDDKIIVEVPEFVSFNNGDLFIVKVTTAYDCGSELCNDSTANDSGWRGYYEYDETLVLPGLCDLSPKEANSKSYLALRGINLGTSGEVYVGEYLADHDGAWGDSEIDGILIPFLEAGNVPVRVLTAEGNYTNPMYLKILASADMPSISSVSPDNGAPGQYIYISGENFGDTIANVWFYNNVVGQVAADTSFPAICMDSWWSNNGIVVKVPDLAIGDYNLIVETTSGESNTFLFAVNNRPLSPGICKIDPVSGPPSTVLTVYGDNFGNSAQTLRIATEDFTNINDWADKEIEAMLPEVEAGDHLLRVISDNGDYSNDYAFKVQYCNDDSQCDGKVCCADGTCKDSCEESSLGEAYFQWKFSTGTIPFLPRVIENKTCGTNLQSPSPWKGSSNACVNTSISARFNTVMTDISLQNAVTVYDCGSDSNCLCTSAEPCAELAGGISIIDTSESDADGNLREMNGFIFNPAELLTANNYYKVLIADTAVSVAGNFLDDTYSWQFQVRDSDEFCSIEEVRIFPLLKYLIPGEIADYNTLLEGENCIILNPNNYDFAWSAANNVEPYIEFVAETGDEETDSMKQVMALAETAEGQPVEINVAVSDSSNTYSNDRSAEVYVTEGSLGLAVRNIKNCVTSYPSPSPYLNSQDACVNSLLSAQFTTVVDATTVNTDNIHLSSCNGEFGEEAFECNGMVNILMGSSSYLRNSDNEVIGFVASPSADLAANTWYEARIDGGDSGIKGFVELDGETVESYLDTDYRWYFHTGEGSCDIEDIIINPAEAYIKRPMGEQEYVTYPVAANCNVINALTKNWSWLASTPAAVDFLMLNSPKQVVKALAESGSSGIDIMATADDVTAMTKLYISFEKPSLLENYPACNSACVNSAIGVKFDQAIDPSRLKMSLYRCANESCLDYNSSLVTTDWISAGDGHEITPADNMMFIIDLASHLDPYNFYKVIVEDVYGEYSSKAMSNYNEDLNGDGDLDAYLWKFKTKSDEELCEIQSVDLSPLSKYSNTVGERQDYLAMPLSGPNECAAKGSYLNPYDFDWEWSSSDVNRVSLSNESISLNLPNYCSASCLFTGSQASLEVCGNGVIETGEDCDDSNTADGDGCSRNCLWEGGTAASCGNSTVDYGEECDIALSTAGCNENCLHIGIVGAVCGNGNKEIGEACDDGNISDGDGCSASCLLEGRNPASNSCGNGIIESEIGEACDDGNVYNDDGCSSTCKLEGYQSYLVNGEAICGDGIVQSGDAGSLAAARGEACDDGNNFSGDGCSSFCTWEGAKFTGADCGNSSIDYGEACDDGNNEAGDGCGGSCLLEGSSIDKPSCGNKIVENGEACDDGNIYNGDGCSSVCLWEGSAFTAGDCGNGVKDYGEACDSASGDFCNDSCQFIGSGLGTDSVCGNGEIGEGEDCDDGNRFAGDGCNEICLNEGTVAGDEVAVCGNGVLENSLGEECDDGNGVSGDGCSSRCLREGNSLSSCGNTIVETALGEDCDDGNKINGDGCSSLCLNEGSSYKNSSVCGNGIIETGEECESSVLATKVSPYQWAIIDRFISDGEKNPNTSTATIFAKEIGSQVNGSAKIILECAFSSDDECPGGSVDYGVGSNKCCYDRPTIINHLPLAGEIDVCRNPQMQVMIDAAVNEMTLRNGLSILRVEKSGDLSNCEISGEYKSQVTDEYLCVFDDWNAKMNYIEVEVDDETVLQTLVSIELKDVLAANSDYYMVYNDELKEVHGVSLKHETDSLKVLNNDDEIVPADIYHFKTAGEVCELNNVQLINIDSSDINPFSLILPEKTKTYQALTYDNRGKAIAPVSGIYDWSWQWLIDPTDIVALDIVNDAEGNPSDLINLAPINNGLANLSAKAVVQTSLNAYACSNNNECNSGVCNAGFCQDEVSTDQNIDVFICSNPWPSSRMYVNDMFNFGMRYCRDANIQKICYGGKNSGKLCQSSYDCPSEGGTGTEICAKDITLDIPALRLSTIIPPTIVRETTGLLREYLFNVVREKSYCYDANLNILKYDGIDLECTGDRSISRCIDTVENGGLGGTCLALPGNPLEATGDIIGLRVFLNPSHVDIASWYAENMSAATVSVKNTKIDGYGALKAGNNYYVHAANLVPNADSYDLYTNVYLFTYNNEASSTTRGIYQELMDSLYFNMNLYGTASYQMWQDWQSSAYANKQKIIRDVKRLEDLQKIAETLESYKVNDGLYPQLIAGTLLPGVSYSTWNSWPTELGLNLVDPVNKFTKDACPYSVGVCVDSSGVESGELCTNNSECNLDLGESCVESIEHLFNQKTCYNSSTQQFDEDQVYFNQPEALVYRYESLDNGARYRFDYHMEYLQHVSILSDGTESSMAIIGSAGECYAEGDWYGEGEAHPSELFTSCHFGRWVSSCGNGVVEPDLGEECESSIEMCSERFGDESWYDPQTKVCNACRWLGVCSNDRDRSCSADDDCQVAEAISCEAHEMIPGISTCQGIGANVGKLCDSDADCMSFGSCLDFDSAYEVAHGYCELNNPSLGVSTTTTSCDDLENSCNNYYSDFYCKLNPDKVCVDSYGRFDNQCSTDADCATPIFSCQDKYVCYNKDTDTYEDPLNPLICDSDADCNTGAGFNCEAISAPNAVGLCYTQSNSPTVYDCKEDLDCDLIENKCSYVGGGQHFSEADCGGYCGDALIQTETEACDWANEAYSNSDNPDSGKPFCSYSCQSSCPSGENGEVFYGGNSYFLRKYCDGGANNGLACTDNADCPDANCRIDTLYDVVFAAEDGFPGGLNLYLPACQRLAQGQWTCHSNNTDYLKEGAWCNPDYADHCVDANGVVGSCSEINGGFEPAAFTTDIDLNDLALTKSHILFIIDRSGSMGQSFNGNDVYCDDPWQNNNPTCSYVASSVVKACGTVSKNCKTLDNYFDPTDYVCTTATGEYKTCLTSVKPNSSCTSSCVRVSSLVSPLKTYYSVDNVITRDCIDPNTAHPDCVAAGVTTCTLDSDAPDERLECAVDALVNTSNGGIQQLVDLDQSNVSFGALSFAFDVTPSFEDFTWYGIDDYGDLVSDLNSLIPLGGTATNVAFDRAAEIFAALPEEEQNDQKMIILLTDGDANAPELTAEAAVSLKNSGVKIYTITYPEAVANSDLWSSECPADINLTEPAYPPCSSEPKYSYQGVGADQSLPEIYEEIINSFMLNLTVGESSQILYSGRYIPLPGEFHCQNEAQLLPVNINISPYLRGEIELSNLRFNYCP